MSPKQPTLPDSLCSFIHSSAHSSPKTVETLQNRLNPFVVYLARNGVYNPLSITREHVEGFIQEIARGRRGKPLSPGSIFDFTKDVQAFVNHIASTIAPDDWRNPVRHLQCRRPQVTIHPLSANQFDTLVAVAQAMAPTPFLKARNTAMLYTLLDGALRISELLNAMRGHLSEDGTLRVMGKGAKERDVALSDHTLELIHDYLEMRHDSLPFLFVSEDSRKLTYTGVKSLFHRWRKQAPAAFQGVRVSAHTLRHTSATMRRLAGMSEGDLQTFLGHATSAMTRHYSAFALSRSANVAARQTSPVDALAQQDFSQGQYRSGR